MRRLHLFGFALLAAAPVVAQTTPPPTCTTPPTRFTAFNIERPLNIGSGLWRYNVQVEDVHFSCQPVPSALIVGRIQQNFPDTPFGNANGALIAIGMGYTATPTPTLNNVTVLIPGIAGLFSPGAVGTVTFPTSSVTPPGTTPQTPTIVFTPGQSQTTFNRQIFLDASRSTDPRGLQLTYAWRQVNSNIPAGINNGNTATPLVTFNGGQGDYVFEVTATNSQGQSVTAQTTITYYGR
jgi:hypothetical protein